MIQETGYAVGVDKTHAAIGLFDVPGRLARRWAGLATDSGGDSAGFFRVGPLDGRTGSETVEPGPGNPIGDVRTVAPAGPFHFGRFQFWRFD